MSIPSSSDLYEAGLVAGVTFVAEFYHFGRCCIAIPNDFYVRKTPDAIVRSAVTRKETTYARISALLASGACTAVVVPCRMKLMPVLPPMPVPVWIGTGSEVMTA